MNLTPSIGTCIACEQPAWPVCRRCTLPVPLPPAADHFAVLQIKRRLHLDLAVLGDQMVRFTQFLAPRRFEASGAEALHVAKLTAAAVKDAYTTLRDPRSRGAYWLSQRNDLALRAPDSVPPELADLLAGPPGEQRAAAIAAAVGTHTATLRRLFQAHDESADAARAVHLSHIRRELELIALLSANA